MDDRALVDKAQVKVENVVADEKIAVGGELPKIFDDVGLFALQDFDGAADRWLDGVTQANNFGRRRRQA